MEGILALLAAAAIGHGLALALRAPPAPFLIVCGFGVARTGMLPAQTVEDAVLLGVTFLLFALGTELDPGRARAHRPAAIRVGMLQFALMGAAGYVLARGVRFDGAAALYVALALTASSTLVVIRLLQRRRQLFEPASRLVVGVLLVQNLLIVLLIPAVTRAGAGAVPVLTGVAASLGLIGVAYLVLRPASPLLLRVANTEELRLLVTLAVLFGFVGLAHLLDLPVIVGAFLAGASLAKFPVNGVIRPQLQPIGDFFTAIFFTGLGALVVPSGPVLLRAAALAPAVIILTPPLVAGLAARSGLSTRAALEAGLLLAQTSEISLVIGINGMLSGQIAPDTFSVIALTTVATMMVTPVLASDRVVWWLTRHWPASAPDTTDLPRAGHVLLLGAGTTGMPLMETVLTAGHEVLVVDDDPAIIAGLHDADIPHIRGDAADLEVLRAAHADRALAISSTLRRPHDNRRVLAFARDTKVLVRVFDEADAAWVRELGGTPIVYSRAAADGFFAWFDRFRGAVTSPAKDSQP